jgi:hypothetical protein
MFCMFFLVPSNMSGPAFTAAAIWDFTQHSNSNNSTTTPVSSHPQIPNNFLSPQQPYQPSQHYQNPSSYLNQSSSSGIAITAASPNTMGGVPNSSVSNSSTGGSISGGGGEEMLIIRSLVAKCENYCEMINVITKIADLRIVQEQQQSRNVTSSSSPATQKGSGQSRAWKESIENYVCSCSLYLHALSLLKNLLASLGSYSVPPLTAEQHHAASSNSTIYPLVVRMKTVSQDLLKTLKITLNYRYVLLGLISDV